MNNTPDPKLFTSEKVRRDAELQNQPEFKFIASNRLDGAPWHIGRRKFTRYSKSGLISSAYYVTACSGQQLGSAWGQTEMSYGDGTSPAHLCERCREWKWKNEQRRGQKISV